MAKDGATASLWEAEGGEDPDPLGRVLLRGRVSGVGEPLVVEVVHQSHQPPGLDVLPRALGHRPHGEFDRVHVLPERVGGGVLVDERQGAIAIEGHRRLRCGQDACA